MSNPYVGEIRMFAGTFAPNGWALCNGQLLPISENEALFALIGTWYGGDGSETFALPNMQGRIPVHQGNATFGGNFAIGEAAGVESVTLTAATTPTHTHAFQTNGAVANTPNAANNLLGVASQVSMYFGDVPNQPMNAGAVGATGGSQPHGNMMPFLTLNFIISLYGIFPSPS